MVRFNTILLACVGGFLSWHLLAAEQPAVAQGPTQATKAVEKSKLRVLFVGHDPTQEVAVPSYASGVAAKRLPELRKERMGAYQMLLKQYFESPKFIASAEYRVKMSDDFDVTVFDVLPPAIDEIDMGTWKRKLRLPKGFDRPAVMIGDVAPRILGRHGLGFRLDHL